MKRSPGPGRNGLVVAAIAVACLAVLLDLRSPRSAIRESDTWHALVALNNRVHRMCVESGLMRCELCERRGRRDERTQVRRRLPTRR